MTSKTKKIIVSSVIGLSAVVGGIALAPNNSAPTMENPIKEPVGEIQILRKEKVLTQRVNNIPRNTILEWDNGKYVPKSVPGYQSKADYPDNFWFYEKDLPLLEGKSLDR